MQKYRLTIVYGFDAEDDVQARERAQEILCRVKADRMPVDSGTPKAVVLVPENKLQRIHANKPPEAVRLT